MTRLNQAASIIVSGLVILISSCTGDHKSTQSGIDPEALPEDIVELRDDQIKLADVALGSVERRSMGKIIKANGIVSVEPRNLATVCMPLGGYVRYTSLVPGNRVNKGQTLAVIENQEFVDIQQHYLEARNKLLFAEKDYNRHTELYKDDIYSEQNVQQVTVEYRNLKAQTRSLEQKLRVIGIDPDELREDNISSSVNLVSPIAGFLKAVNINIGKYVTQTDVLFEIVNSDKLLLELTLFEKDASGISAGQKLKFFINDETEEHDAVITQTARTVSAGTPGRSRSWRGRRRPRPAGNPTHPMSRFRREVLPRQPVVQAAGMVAGQHDDGAVQAHLDLQVALRAAVIGVRSGRRGREGVGHA